MVVAVWKSPEIGFWRGICLNICTKMVFVLTRKGCLLRVHFSRHGIDTLSLGEIRQDVKKWLTCGSRGSITAPRD